MSSANKKLPLRLVVLSLVLVFCFSFLASVFHSGMFSVNISRISFDDCLPHARDFVMS